jgi:PAS domain-containing protein
MALEECPMAQTLKEGKAVLGKTILIETPDGRRVFVRPHPAPIFDKEGNLSGAFNVLQNISENYALEAKAAHLAAIVESSEDAVISKTMEGIVTSWNESATRIFE